MGKLGRKERNVLTVVFVALIVFGLVINFIPTLRYFLIMYPHQVSIDSDRAYEKYNVDLGFALVKINKTPTKPLTIVFTGNECSVTFRHLNDATGFAYEAVCNLTLSFPFNGSQKNVTIRSSGIIRGDSPLAKLLIINGSGDRLNINVSGLNVTVRKVPPNVVSFRNLLTVHFYLKPVGYHGKGMILNAKIDRFTYLTYYVAGKGKLLLASYVDFIDRRRGSHYDILGKDRVTAQILEMMLKGSPYEDLMLRNRGKLDNVDVGLDLNYTNVRLVNDVVGRILFDLTFTYFPINLVLIVVGFIGLVVVRRRRI